VRVVTSLNRGMKALGATMRRRGFGYVLALTVLITFAGAAGMYSFERAAPGGQGFASYGEALWWTAMLLTSLGSAYWPQSAEGRILCLLLALYGFAVFGYLTATLASFFIGRDAEDDEAELASAEDVRGVQGEIAALREAVRALSERR
jgi:voltage-gated potassium channel